LALISSLGIPGPNVGKSSGANRLATHLLFLKWSSTLFGRGDWLQFMLDLPMVAEPGMRFACCIGNPHVLSIIVSQATGTNALEFARQELFGPLGIHDVSWPPDRRGHNHGWRNLQLHPRDMARLGQLFLQSGVWNERHILSESWIAAATCAHVEHTVNKDH
jgi:CubicO group peptidase (beta-lactamase class C family)